MKNTEMKIQFTINEYDGLSSIELDDNSHFVFESQVTYTHDSFEPILKTQFEVPFSTEFIQDVKMYYNDGAKKKICALVADRLRNDYYNRLIENIC